MNQKAFSISKISRIGFTIGSLGLVCLLLFASYLGQRFVTYFNYVQDSEEVLHKISSISILMERAEAGYRGYLFTLDGRLLRRYHLAAGSIQTDIENLNLAVVENPDQVKAVKLLKTHVYQLFAEHDEVIENVKKLSHQQITEHIVSGDMKAIRESLQNLELEETRIMSERSDDADVLFNSGLTFLILGTITGIGLMMWSRRDLSRTARAAFAQNSLLNSVVENLSAGLVVLDSDGAVRFANSEFSHMLGFNIEGLKLQSREQFFECLNPISRQPIPAEELPLAKALRGEFVNDFEMVIHTFAHGKDAIVTCSSRPIFDDKKQIIGAMCVYRDIAKRKRIEEEWQKSREMAMENVRLKSDFLNQLSQEIRTPMNGVISMSQLLMDSVLTSEQVSFVKNIQISSQYLLNLIQSVSDQSLFEKGMLKLESSPFKIAKCIQQIVNMLEPAAESRNIQLFLDSEIEPDLEVIGDSTRIQEVLVDTIEKAIQQTDQGFVSIKVKVLEVFDGKARFYFEVKNTSIKEMPTAAKSGSSKEQLINEIVRQLDGEIETEYQKNVGHRFSLTVDLNLKIGSDKKIVKHHTQIIADKPILVAEDQVINQMVIRKYLERFGLQCHIVSDGRSAFLEATTGKYCIVLMDCKMQPIDGYEATQLIRTHEKRQGTRIPIIALTADGTVEDRKRCENVGMDDYIVKPIELNKLETTLQKWIQPVLKEEYIKKLDGYQMEGKPLLNVLAEDYFDSTPGLIDKLETSINNSDVKKTQYFAHTLKSSSITLGLVELSQLCQKLESSTDIDAQSKTILGQIKDCYRRSEPVLRRRILTRSV